MRICSYAENIMAFLSWDLAWVKLWYLRYLPVLVMLLQKGYMVCTFRGASSSSSLSIQVSYHARTYPSPNVKIIPNSNTLLPHHNHLSFLGCYTRLDNVNHDNGRTKKAALFITAKPYERESSSQERTSKQVKITMNCKIRPTWMRMTCQIASIFLYQAIRPYFKIL